VLLEVGRLDDFVVSPFTSSLLLLLLLLASRGDRLLCTGINNRAAGAVLRTGKDWYGLISSAISNTKTADDGIFITKSLYACFSCF